MIIVGAIGTRAAIGGRLARSALPTRQGRSIAAPALFCALIGEGLEQLRAAYRVEQSEAVNIGRAAVDGAHGACSANADKICLLTGNVGVAEFLEAIFDEIVLHNRSFLTTRADYSDSVNTSYKAEVISMSSDDLAPGIDGAEHGANAACQYTKYARSGHAVDAVRVHSFLFSLTRLNSSHRSPCFFVLLTPARWQANRMAGQISASFGSGGAVLARTVQNHRQNQQHIEIIAQSLAVLKFCAFASRHTCVRVHVRLCAYVCVRNSRTSEPHQYIVINHIDISSGLGSVWFWSEPVLLAAVERRAIAPVSIKQVGRYASPSACRGLLHARPGESFGVFVLAVQLLGLDPPLVDLASSNDAFLRLPTGQSGDVGMVMLERCAEGGSNPSLSGNWPLPIGKARTIAQVRPGTPPMPPFASRPFTSSLARQLCQNLEGLRRLNHIGTWRPARLEKCRNGWRQNGSGKGKAVRFNPFETGRGKAKTAGKLHRICQAIGGAADVN